MRLASVKPRKGIEIYSLAEDESQTQPIFAYWDWVTT